MQSPQHVVIKFTRYLHFHIHACHIIHLHAFHMLHTHFFLFGYSISRHTHILHVHALHTAHIHSLHVHTTHLLHHLKIIQPWNIGCFNDRAVAKESGRISHYIPRSSP